MSFSPQVFNKKLSGLLETQDSIVTISQWILFHHRHSKESAKLWSDYILALSPSTSLSSKKLSLLYLCNDVVQQARHKKKSEFITNFAQVLPNVFNRIYLQVNDSIKPKISRLVDVWEQRSVFPPNDIKKLKEAIELSKLNKRIGEDLKPPAATTSSNSAPSISPELNLLNSSLIHINSLNDSNQGNLQQISIQSKTYLPSDPSASDNLPSPKIYLSKLNVLEKLCQLATNNIDSIKKERTTLLTQLENLTEIIKNGIKTDENKKNLVNLTINKLNETKTELEEMIEDDYEPEIQNEKDQPEEPSPELEEPSPVLEDEYAADDDDEIPKYEDSNDEDESSDIELPPSKKQKTSRSPSVSSGASTPSSKKSVAFSEDVEIKEYEREERTQFIQVQKSDDEYSASGGDDDEGDYEPSIEFEKHHKDDLELKHEHDEDEYEPSDSLGSGGSGSDVQNDVLSILSKLA